MPDYQTLNSAMGQYFRTLPKTIQEDIIQSGVVFHTEIDMRRCVDTLMGDRPR